MSEKKLLIKLKYGASTLPEKSSPSLHRHPEYDWNYNRVAFALGIGLIVLALSAYSFFIESMDRNTSDQPAEIDLPTVSERYLKQPLLNSPAADRQTALMRPDENPSIEAPRFPNGKNDSSIKESVPRQNSSIVAEIPSNEVKPETGLAKAAASPDEARVESPLQAESKPIVRARFAWGIQNREPTGAISSPAILQLGDSVTIYFFSEFKQLNGQTVSHEWSHNGRVTHIRNFQIRADRWRVFSSKHLNSERLGEWKVTIRNSDGKILGEYVLNVFKPAKRPI